MAQKWIITGANGYLGREICHYIHSSGENVLGLARSDKKLDALISNKIPCKTYEKVGSSISKSDVVVHCAGKVGNTGTWDDFVQINCNWSVSLYEQAQKNSASCFVYVSSVAALGYKNRLNNTLDELSAPAHVQGEFYGRSKLLAEEILLEKAKNSMTRLIILRPGLIYGNRNLSIQQTWLKRGIVVDRKQRIPLIHINNFVDTMIKAVRHNNAHGIFFVVDEEQPEVRYLDELKIHYGLQKYHPWHIGKTGFCLLWILRGFYRSLRGRFNLSFKNQAIAEYYFQTRRLMYSTKKIDSVIGDASLVRLNDGLERERSFKNAKG